MGGGMMFSGGGGDDDPFSGGGGGGGTGGLNKDSMAEPASATDDQVPLLEDSADGFSLLVSYG